MRSSRELEIWSLSWTGSCQRSGCSRPSIFPSPAPGVKIFCSAREELEAVETMRRALNGLRSDEAVDNILTMFSRTHNNQELIQMVKKTKLI